VEFEVADGANELEFEIDAVDETLGAAERWTVAENGLCRDGQ
jgi:hypothetical protein